MTSAALTCFTSQAGLRSFFSQILTALAGAVRSEGDPYPRRRNQGRGKFLLVWDRGERDGETRP